jgi:hypothetical protein
VRGSPLWCRPGACTANTSAPQGSLFSLGAGATAARCESDLRREGFEVVHGVLKPGHMGEAHAHEFGARIMVLGGEITLVRDGKSETFRAGDHCEVPAGCTHTECVGPKGSPTLPGKPTLGHPDTKGSEACPLSGRMALVSEAQPIAAWMVVQCRTRPGAATRNFLRGVSISRK